MSTTGSVRSTLSSPRSNNNSGDDAKQIQRKEVDYYLNPTELFRWINYRRWDGAKARVLSHPDECSTWIVSKHSSDGRILWRHLPLHLVCMQSDNTDNESGVQTNTTHQIEELIDILLDAYPEAASSPDDQGMLPLHLTLANSSHPNERIVNLLLMTYPTAVEVKDKYGRTPVDVIKEKAENGPQREAALRAMSRAKRTTLQLIEAVRQENAETVLSMKQEASNERMASQRIIVRLEEELQKTNKDLEEIESKKRDGEGSVSQLKQEVAKLQAEREKERQLALSVKRERDDLMDQNEVLQNQIQEHENVVKALHQEFEDERQGRSDSVAKLKSELSTAKAMAEALESQLRSRFTNEEYLTNTVSELETQIADLNSEFQQKKTKLMNERDAYENENTQLKRNVDDLSKKSASLQAKLTEVNRQMSAVLSSHGALNAEHDRIIDSTLRTEAELIEATRTERAEMLAMIRKQWEFFESSVKEQEQMLEDFQQKEINMLEMAKEERDRSFEMISNMRQDFRDARVSAMDRQRTLQTDTLVSPISNGLKTSSSDSVKSKPQSVGHSASSSQQTRRTHARGSSDQSNSRKELISTGISKSMSSSTYTARSGRQELPPPRPVESRLPASTEMSSGEKRQDHMESNLLHLLESRADQGSGRHRRGFSATESTSYGTSGASSSSALGPRQRVIATDASTAASSSSSPAARPTSNAPRITTKPLRKSHSLSLDEYSQASSVSIDESDDDVSSRPSRNTKPSNQYSGMTTGMRLGTIRISEEASELDSRYSRQ